MLGELIILIDLRVFCLISISIYLGPFLVKRGEMLVEHILPIDL